VKRQTAEVKRSKILAGREYDSIITEAIKHVTFQGGDVIPRSSNSLQFKAAA
jgi:hypothetical protein